MSEAWIKARPYEEYKFEDRLFKKQVDSANGKWLEKKHPGDTYKIILGLQGRKFEDLLETYVHEVRHCIDYQKAVQKLPFKNYYSGNEYYNNWSEFRAVIADTRLEFFVKAYQGNKVESKKDIFEILAEVLGEKQQMHCTD